MDATELYEEVDTFYQIRADNYARQYVLKFINAMLNGNIDIKDFHKWTENNRLKYDFRDKDEAQYNKVLDQFIRYINAVNNTNIHNHNVHKKHSKTKIYNTFYDLQKTTDEKIE